MLSILSLRSGLAARVLFPVVAFVLVATLDPFGIERVTERTLDRLFQRVSASFDHYIGDHRSTAIVLLWTDRSGHGGRTHWPLRSEEIFTYLQRIQRGGVLPDGRRATAPVIFLDTALVTGRCPPSLIAQDAAIGCHTLETNPCLVHAWNPHYRATGSFRDFYFSHLDVRPPNGPLEAETSERHYGYFFLDPDNPGQRSEITADWFAEERKSLLLVGAFPSNTEFGDTARYLQRQNTRRFFADYYQNVLTLEGADQGMLSEHPLIRRVMNSDVFSDPEVLAYIEYEGRQTSTLGSGEQFYQIYGPEATSNTSETILRLDEIAHNLRVIPPFEAELMRPGQLPCLNDRIGTVDITYPADPNFYPLWNVYDINASEGGGDWAHQISANARNEAGHVVTLTPALAMLDLYCRTLEATETDDPSGQNRDDTAAPTYKGCDDRVALLARASTATASEGLLLTDRPELRLREDFWADHPGSPLPGRPPIPWCQRVPDYSLLGVNLSPTGFFLPHDSIEQLHNARLTGWIGEDEQSRSAVDPFLLREDVVLCQSVDAAELISLARSGIHDPQILGNDVAGRPVFVGFDTSFDLDRIPAPLFDQTPGVMIHAMAFEQLLHHGLDYKRPSDGLLVSIQASILLLLGLVRLLLIEPQHAANYKRAAALQQTIVGRRRHLIGLAFGASARKLMKKWNWLYTPVWHAVALAFMSLRDFFLYIRYRYQNRQVLRGYRAFFSDDTKLVKQEIRHESLSVQKRELKAFVFFSLGVSALLIALYQPVFSLYAWASWAALLVFIIADFFWMLVYLSRFVFPFSLPLLGLVSVGMFDIGPQFDWSGLPFVQTLHQAGSPPVLWIGAIAIALFGIVLRYVRDRREEIRLKK